MRHVTECSLVKTVEYTSDIPQFLKLHQLLKKINGNTKQSLFGFKNMYRYLSMDIVSQSLQFSSSYALGKLFASGDR